MRENQRRERIEMARIGQQETEERERQARKKEEEGLQIANARLQRLSRDSTTNGADL